MDILYIGYITIAGFVFVATTVATVWAIATSKRINEGAEYLALGLLCGSMIQAILMACFIVAREIIN